MTKKKTKIASMSVETRKGIAQEAREAATAASTVLRCSW